MQSIFVFDVNGIYFDFVTPAPDKVRRIIESKT